jgi:outer membrane protein
MHTTPVSIARQLARHAALALACFAAPIALGADLTTPDVFGTMRNVPAYPAASEFGEMRADPCSLGPLESPLSLFESVEHALCNNPRTRASWANIKAQAAQVGQTESSYLPTVSGSIVAAHDHNSTFFKSPLVSDVADRTHYASETVALNWVLFDFGTRGAAVAGAKKLLAAADADHNATLQQVFVSTARDYYSAIAGQANINATIAAEENARKALDIATARVTDGLSAISDQWQAKTAYSQATYNRVRAQSDYRRELGTLAIDMGLPPDTPIVLSQALESAQPDATFNQAITDLLTEAAHDHPSLASARAQLDAAKARVDMVRAQGRPTISLVTRRSRNNQPVSLGTGEGDVGAEANDTYIGLEIDIPFFEGFSRGYQIRAAQAEVEQREANLHDAEQQVALGVWNSYEALKSETENLKNTDVTLDSAQKALDATQYRYQKGVGGIVELLSAQTALANANLQHILAQANWRSARLMLAASLGHLGTINALNP